MFIAILYNQMWPRKADADADAQCWPFPNVIAWHNEYIVKN